MSAGLVGLVDWWTRLRQSYAGQVGGDWRLEAAVTGRQDAYPTERVCLEKKGVRGMHE